MHLHNVVKLSNVYPCQGTKCSINTKCLVEFSPWKRQWFNVFVQPKNLSLIPSEYVVHGFAILCSLFYVILVKRQFLLEAFTLVLYLFPQRLVKVVVQEVIYITPIPVELLQLRSETRLTFLVLSTIKIGENWLFKMNNMND